ncbi:hypothetical protein TGAM01_v201979, partial [Trichoderma gamsii]
LLSLIAKRQFSEKLHRAYFATPKKTGCICLPLFHGCCSTIRVSKHSS